MNARTVVAVLVAATLATGCGRKQSPTPPHTAARAVDADERTNLLNLAYGASVVSRTAESMLDFAAVRAIDGDPGSYWLSPPEDVRQTLTFSLPARSRLTQLGVQTSDNVKVAVREVRFALSVDGINFSPPITMKPAATLGVQLTAIPPTEASYVRIETIAAGEKLAQLISVQARGQELKKPQPRLEGCWIVNGEPAWFRQQGARVYGSIGGRHPIRLEGGSDGRLFRFAWVRGQQYGYAAISVTPDAKNFAGMLWHEEAIPLFFRSAWQGIRNPCATPPSPPQNVLANHLDRIGRFPLFGLTFDDRNALDEARSSETLGALAAQLKSGRFRLVSREYRYSEGRNAEVAATRLNTLAAALRSRGVELEKDALVPLGSSQPRQDPSTAVMRALYGCIEMERLP